MTCVFKAIAALAVASVALAQATAIAVAGVSMGSPVAGLVSHLEPVDAVAVYTPIFGLNAMIAAHLGRWGPSVDLGVSPRGAAATLRAAKSWAWLSGRDFVTPDEVKAVAKPAMRHRLMIRPELELEGTTADGVLDAVLATVPAPR